jgi:hypothetical protein
MQRHIARLLLVMFCSFLFLSCRRGTQGQQGSLSENEVLALVAGAALPENLISEIRDRGLSFHVDVFYRSEMEKARADPKILSALDSAKVIVASGSEERGTRTHLTG